MNAHFQRTPHYSIRLARRDDLIKIQAIEKAAAQLFRATSYADLADDDGMSLVDLEQWLIDGKIWVAVDQADEPVGFVVAHVVDGTAYVHELDIDPQHGRQGLGARLIDTVAAWAREYGYGALTLSTFADVAWNAPYYARLGFRMLGLDELGPGLRAVRDEEAASGLAIEKRVCMIRPVG